MGTIFKDMRDFEKETNLWAPMMDKEFGINWRNFLRCIGFRIRKWDLNGPSLGDREENGGFSEMASAEIDDVLLKLPQSLSEWSVVTAI